MSQPAGKRPAPRMRCVRETVVARMLAELPGETDPALQAGFGISYNTWRKVRAGEPVRCSVADRLERRLADAG